MLSRRLLLTGSAAMFPGLPPRRLDQHRQPMDPGVTPGTPNTLIAKRVIIRGPNEGLFAYSGAPALGNLIETSGIAVAGKDAKGNAYLTGSTTYANLGGGVYRALQNTGAQLVFWFSTGAPGGPYVSFGYVTANNTGDLVLVSPESDITLSLTASGGYDVLLGRLVGTTPITVATNEPGTTATPETYHAVAVLANGWINAAGFQGFAYKLKSCGDEVAITGVISGTGASSTVFYTLPAAYWPVLEQGWAAGATGGDPAGAAANVRVDTAGNLSLAQGAALPAADSYLINGSYYLNT